MIQDCIEGMLMTPPETHVFIILTSSEYLTGSGGHSSLHRRFYYPRYDGVKLTSSNSPSIDSSAEVPSEAAGRALVHCVSHTSNGRVDLPMIQDCIEGKPMTHN
jgi:hypothetical protein